MTVSESQQAFALGLVRFGAGLVNPCPRYVPPARRNVIPCQSVACLASQGEGGSAPSGSYICAAALLLEVTRESEPSVLARWLPHASALAEAAASLAATADTRPSAGATFVSLIQMENTTKRARYFNMYFSPVYV